ncbi:DUF695 domain-containing protein [Gilvibacter sp.]|uniref:DUF695 domain-containing protein n=1 Tax=Gilvibacter sp. TaxID=2729997 RepID=UPI003F4A2407
MAKNEKVSVTFPELEMQTTTFNKEDHTGILNVNMGLAKFEHKRIFPWHCSLIIDNQYSLDNGLPTRVELKEPADFIKYLDQNISHPENSPRNALFLANIYWNHTRKIIWRVHNPELTNSFLQGVIESKNHLREFKFNIEFDADWNLTEWHLS